MRFAQKIPAVIVDRDHSNSYCLVRCCAWCIRDPVSTLMIVHFKPSALRQTRWYEYLVRFVLGGAMTAIAGLIAARLGPIIGGLFLAFPAIFPASATLIEKHVRERKEKVGLQGARRGKEAAALDAAGAALGSFGLAAFGLVVWLIIVQSPAWALVLAAASWFAVAVLGWQVRRWL
jgi:MFS family permease